MLYGLPQATHTWVCGQAGVASFSPLVLSLPRFSALTVAFRPLAAWEAAVGAPGLTAFRVGAYFGHFTSTMSTYRARQIVAALRSRVFCFMLRIVCLGFAAAACVTLLPVLSSAAAQRAPGSPTTSPADSLIEIGEDRPVRIGADHLRTIEPYLSANPRNADHLVAGVFLVRRQGDPRRADREFQSTCAALTSYDAGRSWARHDFPVLECIDPWTAIRPDGSAVFVMLGKTPDSVDRGLLVFSSADGGRTWSDSPVFLGYGHDHPTLAVDTTRGPFSGSLYIASHETGGARDGATRRDVVFVARSADGGATFGEPVRIMASNLPPFSMNPAVLADGTLAVPFINFVHSIAGEYTFFSPGAPSWMATSSDGGRTFSVPRFINDICAGGFPQLAVDASSGPYLNRLYWVCRDRTSERIYVSHSTDRGESWSEPIVVNHGSGHIPYIQNVVIAVNRDGVIGISWYDARNDPREYRGSLRCQDLFFTASFDGARTFSPDAKVSSAENCPDTPANDETGKYWNAGGDYHGLAAAADGRFHVLWADSREGVYQLRTATIRVPRRPAQPK